MQNFSNILTQFDDMGLVFSLGENNLLKVVPKEKITDQARLFIRDHKAEIVDILSLKKNDTFSNPETRYAMLHRQPEINTALHPCPLCHSDLLSPGLDGCFHRSTLSGESGGDLKTEGSSKLSRPTPGRFKPKQENTIPPFALEWLQIHRRELRQAGWTGRELYRRNKSPGICWCGLWDKPFLTVYLHDNGVIELEAVIEGRDIIQTARPMHRARKI